MSDNAENQYLSVIRVWAAMAWADGVIADSERAAIQKLIAVAQLSDGEKATAEGFLDSKVELDTAQISGLSDQAREGIYRAAARLAMVDLELAEEESAMLERLRDGLGLDAARCRELAGAITENA
jgi:uncharacterized membrane protein YebE (DUF533 family)